MTPGRLRRLVSSERTDSPARRDKLAWRVYDADGRPIGTVFTIFHRHRRRSRTTWAERFVIGPPDATRPQDCIQHRYVSIDAAVAALDDFHNRGIPPTPVGPR